MGWAELWQSVYRMQLYRGPDQEQFEHLDVTIDGELHHVELGNLESFSDSAEPPWMLLWLFDHVDIRRHPIGAFHTPDGRALYRTRSGNLQLVLALGETQPGLYAASLEASFPVDHFESVEHWQYHRVQNPTELASAGVDFVTADLDYEHCGFDLRSEAGMNSSLPTGTISDLDSHGRAITDALTRQPSRNLVPRFLTVREATPAVILPGIPTFLVRADVAATLGVGGAGGRATELFNPPIFVRPPDSTSASAPSAV